MESGGGDAVPPADRRKHRRLLPASDTLPDCLPDPESIARGYQLDALEMAKKMNTIVFLETGSGKTLIAIMLLRSFAHQLRKPSKYIAVFLVPTVVLVSQQEEAISIYTDLKVRKLYGEMGVDFWDAKTWEKELDEYEVFVMTPAILQRNLEHSFFKLDMLKLLVLDECHHARGRHPYACIMRDFYHRQLRSSLVELPRIFGMTASPIKTKGSSSSLTYGKHIFELGTLMNSKLFTVASESELALYIPFAVTKLKLYEQVNMPQELLLRVTDHLKFLREKQFQSMNQNLYEADIIESARKRIRRLYATFIFCLEELGILLLLKAAECLSVKDVNLFFWGETKNGASEKIIRNFSQDLVQEFSRYIKPDWNINIDLSAGGGNEFLSSKVSCLLCSLMEYRQEKDMRCIVFVQRVITAIVLHSLVSQMLQFSHWKSTYVAGNRSGLQSQTRKEQCKIVDAFRDGKVNLIFSTQILEEGLDVQSCKLVIRFDDCTTVCSFIQSRGRARMKDSDYLLLVRKNDPGMLSKVMNYMRSGDMMREESLRQYLWPLPLLNDNKYDEEFFRVETTGASVSLSSSVELIYYYCSKLPSDMYFKPSPRFEIDSLLETCTLHLPRSSPIQQIFVHGPVKVLKKLACLEACKQLHGLGALTDRLVPLLDEDETTSSDDFVSNSEFLNNCYFPHELVVHWSTFIKKSMYYGYVLHFESSTDHGVSLNNIILVTKCELSNEVARACCLLHARRGDLKIFIEQIGAISLDSNQVSMGRTFQLTILRILLDRDMHKLNDMLNGLFQEDNATAPGYLLLPLDPILPGHVIDWRCVSSFLFYSHINRSDGYFNERLEIPRCLCNSGTRHLVQTYNCKICICLLKNSIVFTPHNGRTYYVLDVLHHINGHSIMKQKDGGNITYKEYFRSRHGCSLHHANDSLLRARNIFNVQKCFRSSSVEKSKDAENGHVELPPELCEIVMSPIPVGTLYAFSFVPQVMYYIESLLLAVTLKRLIQVNSFSDNLNIPAVQVLEAVTTKRCQMGYSLESLETLGDSFLKYAVSQQLFREYDLYHEGILSAKREKLLSNKALYKLGCKRQLPGFIRNECFDPKSWAVPGYGCTFLGEDRVHMASVGNVYVSVERELKEKTIADAVEALIGAYLSFGGELAALSLMEWLGLKIDFVRKFPLSPSLVRPEMHVNVNYLESLLGYTFRDKSLLLEALTHGSYMVPEVPRCYQRLEFIGDSILDFLITLHLYRMHPGLTPGLLTDLRSASVNNDCYAHAAIKAGLHKHILYLSSVLHSQIASAVNEIDTSMPSFSFGWVSDAILPKALGDIIESIAGAILIDSGFCKETVWNIIKPLLEPLVTPDTIKYHPVRELSEVSGKGKLDLEYSKTFENGVTSMTVMVKVGGHIYSETCSAKNKKSAKRFVAKAMLKKLRSINVLM